MHSTTICSSSNVKCIIELGVLISQLVLGGQGCCEEKCRIRRNAWRTEYWGTAWTEYRAQSTGGLLGHGLSMQDNIALLYCWRTLPSVETGDLGSGEECYNVTRCTNAQMHIANRSALTTYLYV